MTSVATSNTPRDRLKPQALIKACNVDAQCDGFRPTVHTRRHASCSEQYLMRAHSSEPVSSRSRHSRGLADMHAQSDTSEYTCSRSHGAVKLPLDSPLVCAVAVPSRSSIDERRRRRGRQSSAPDGGNHPCLSRTCQPLNARRAPASFKAQTRRAKSPAFDTRASICRLRSSQCDARGLGRV